MRLIYLLLAMTLTSSLSYSQAYIKDYLRNKMETQTMEYYPIVIKFRQQSNAQKYQQKLVQKEMNRAMRQQLVLKKLKNENVTPLEFVALAKLYRDEIKNLRTYWLVNAASCKASKIAIAAIAELKCIESIQYDLPTYAHKVEIATPDKSINEVGQAEPGLVSINARPMWALGYTGRNTVLMSFDSGVNLEHPAVGERYLGHYRPQSETWYGVEHPYPFDSDRQHYHGTHTTGTVLGLDKVNNDTVGVAFNAFWKACDLIVSSINDVRPMSDYYAAFEWAANPDGDINTTSDIPDAINNSWGVDYDMWPDCNPVEYQFIANLEAADCSVLFSAGNSGPEESTTGMPAAIIMDSLNVFAVGAINAHDNDLPIAGFSSRGPSFCTDNDPIAIKPEVSAPGVNVRSAAATGEYISISGTSMACPHVTGAVLLLREAFPNATSTELKNALYQTATDLGEVGEDNTYGTGMINVYAAYLFLSETHTPTPPISNAYDLSIAVTNSNIAYVCQESNNYQLEIKNNGTENIENIHLKASINGTVVSEEALSISINAGESITQNINLTLTEPKNEILFEVSKEGIQELNIYNNYRSLNVQRLFPQNLPYSENFDETEAFLQNSSFVVINPDHQKTWCVDSTKGLENNFCSLKMPFAYYNPREEQKDFLIMGTFSIPQENETVLKFKHAYTQYFNSRKDSLYILISNSENTNISDTIWVKGGSNLKTRSGNLMGNFTPADSTEWANNTVDLTAYAGQNVIIKFMAINDGSNNLYIDELSIINGTGLSVDNLNANVLNIYPNPATDKITFDVDLMGQTLEILTTEGQVVFSKEIHQQGIDVSFLKSGHYIVKTSKDFVGKLLIQK